MPQPQNDSIADEKIQLSSYVSQKLPKCVTRDSVHLFRQTLEFEVPLLFWRLKAMKSEGELCRSRVYTIATKPASQWQFIIYKNDPFEKEIDFTVSLIRPEKSQIENMTVSGVLKIYEENALARSMRFRKSIRKAKTVSELSCTIPPEFSRDPKKDFFTICCDLEVLQIDYCSANVKQATNDDSLLQTFNHVWDVADEGDAITIKLNDYECRAHKSILSARSPVFAAMFEHGTQEKQTNSVAIEDLDKPVLRLMMQFIYTNQIAKEQLNEDKVSKLLLAADKYMLNGLKDKCEHLLIEKLSLDNCTRLLQLGTACCAKRLISDALYYVSSKIQQSLTLPELQRKLSDQKFVQCIANFAYELEACNEKSGDTVRKDCYSPKAKKSRYTL